MQNKGEYKGLFYDKNDSTHKYYEGGAHFKYIDLFNALKNLSKKNSYSKTRKEKNNSLSQGKNKINSNNNASTNKNKNKSSKNLLISDNRTPINFLIKFHKKNINSNEQNKSLSKSKNLNNSHNHKYKNISKLGITQFLNLKVNNKKNLYNISDLENNSKLSNISRLKEKISYDNANMKHQPKSRNSQDKRIRNRTKKDNSCLANNNIYDYNYNDNNYNYFFIEQKIDKIKNNQKNTMTNKYKKIINSQNTNNYLDYFKITKITPRSRGSLNKNTVMLNIRKLKNKNITQKSVYNVKDNNSINNITNSFIKKKKNRLSFDQNSKISKIGYKLSSNTSTGEDTNIKNKNNFKSNKSPILNDSLYKRRNKMTLLTLNKFDESLYKKYNKIVNNSNSTSKNKMEKNAKANNNKKVLKYINQYIIKSNGLKRQNSRNNYYCSYRNKYILNDLPKKITDNTYNNINALKKNKKIEMNININQAKFHYKISSRNIIINNKDKTLKSIEKS